MFCNIPNVFHLIFLKLFLSYLPLSPRHADRSALFISYIISIHFSTCQKTIPENRDILLYLQYHDKLLWADPLYMICPLLPEVILCYLLKSNICFQLLHNFQQILLVHPVYQNVYRNLFQSITIFIDIFYSCPFMFTTVAIYSRKCNVFIWCFKSIHFYYLSFLISKS